MTQNQTQEKSLEQRLLEIGSLSHLTRDLNDSKKPNERVGLYSNIAGILSEGNEQDYKTAYGDMRLSLEEAYRYAHEGTQTRVNDAEGLYSRNKGKIIKEVTSSMENDLKSAKNKHQAASILSNYFMGLFNVPELDQVTADEYAQNDFANKIGVGMNFSARGHIEDYREAHKNLQARIFASKFLRELNSKDGKEKVYTVNKTKLNELMDKVNPAAVVYTNARRLKEAKKQKANKE